ncbi:MAG: hypothetical protein VYC40_05180 [Pseudomonadota bacterium]|nr:hypothetical protein [Pseudomonadota bacterium]
MSKNSAEEAVSYIRSLIDSVASQINNRFSFHYPYANHQLFERINQRIGHISTALSLIVLLTVLVAGVSVFATPVAALGIPAISTIFSLITQSPVAEAILVAIPLLAGTAIMTVACGIYNAYVRLCQLRDLSTQSFIALSENSDLSNLLQKRLHNIDLILQEPLMESQLQDSKKKLAAERTMIKQQLVDNASLSFRQEQVILTLQNAITKQITEPNCDKSVSQKLSLYAHHLSKNTLISTLQDIDEIDENIDTHFASFKKELSDQLQTLSFLPETDRAPHSFTITEILGYFASRTLKKDLDGTTLIKQYIEANTDDSITTCLKTKTTPAILLSSIEAQLKKIIEPEVRKIITNSNSNDKSDNRIDHLPEAIMGLLEKKGISKKIRAYLENNIRKELSNASLFDDPTQATEYITRNIIKSIQPPFKGISDSLDLMTQSATFNNALYAAKAGFLIIDMLSLGLLTITTGIISRIISKILSSTKIHFTDSRKAIRKSLFQTLCEDEHLNNLLVFSEHVRSIRSGKGDPYTMFESAGRAANAISSLSLEGQNFVEKFFNHDSMLAAKYASTLSKENNAIVNKLAMAHYQTDFKKMQADHAKIMALSANFQKEGDQDQVRLYDEHYQSYLRSYHTLLELDDKFNETLMREVSEKHDAVANFLNGESGLSASLFRLNYDRHTAELRQNVYTLIAILSKIHGIKGEVSIQSGLATQLLATFQTEIDTNDYPYIANMLQDQENIRSHIMCYDTPRLEKLKSNLDTLQSLLSQEAYSPLNEDINRLHLPLRVSELKKGSPSKNSARRRRRLSTNKKK